MVAAPLWAVVGWVLGSVMVLAYGFPAAAPAALAVAIGLVAARGRREWLEMMVRDSSARVKPWARSADRFAGPLEGVNVKRLVVAGLWLYAFWALGSMTAFLVRVPDLLGPILGLAAGFIVGVDPRRLIWARPPASSATAPNAA